MPTRRVSAASSPAIEPEGNALPDRLLDVREAAAPLADPARGLALPPVEAVDGLPAEALPAFVAQLSALAMRAAARMALPGRPQHRVETDRLLTVGEASERTGMSRAWLYRHKANLPFSKRIGRKVLFSEAGMTRWIATRGH